MSETVPFVAKNLSVRIFLLVIGLGIFFHVNPLVYAVEKSTPPKKVAGEKIEVVADELEYNQKEKKIIGRGNVVVSYQETKLSADYAEVETETKKAYAKGHVVILRGDSLSGRGNEVNYDFEQDQGLFPDGKIINGAWYSKGKKVEQIERGQHLIEGAGVTSCDLERPHYELRAKKVTIHSGDKIFARDVKLYILGKPVFWLPFLVIPLQDQLDSPIQIQPGYSSQHGGYILTSKGFSVTKWLWAKWHADWRSKRGFGGGLDMHYHFDRFKTDGLIQAYLTQDNDAPTPGLVNPYESREDRIRGRLSWRHRTDFNPNTYLLARFHRAADEFFLQDFFEKEFRADVDPTSFVNFTANSDRHGFYVFNQKRINRFENVQEHLPEIRFDWKNSPFFSDKLYYESITSLANLNQKYARSDLNDNVFRWDNFHKLVMPLKWNEIKLTPATFFRETVYGRERFEEDTRARTAFGGSVDLRTQFYRLFNTSFDRMGIEANQLRHVFEPSIRYDSTFHSSVSSEELFNFSTVEEVDDANLLTFGLENRIQTKRVVAGKMQRVDIVSLNTFLSMDFHPDEEYSRSGFSSWKTEMQLRPYQWLQFEIRADYDMKRDNFREVNEDLLIKTKKWRILLGHRLVAKNRLLGADGNSQFVFDGSYWINTRWQIGGYVRWDAEDHELEEWRVSFTRDLHDFLLDFGYNVRNSDIDNSNKEFFFLLRLKAFPEYPLKSGNRASFSEPRIGPTVAGSRQGQGFSGVEA